MKVRVNVNDWRGTKKLFNTIGRERPDLERWSNYILLAKCSDCKWQELSDASDASIRGGNNYLTPVHYYAAAGVYWVGRTTGSDDYYAVHEFATKAAAEIFYSTLRTGTRSTWLECEEDYMSDAEDEARRSVFEDWLMGRGETA